MTTAELVIERLWDKAEETGEVVDCQALRQALLDAGVIGALVPVGDRQSRESLRRIMYSFTKDTGRNKWKVRRARALYRQVQDWLIHYGCI